MKKFIVKESDSFKLRVKYWKCDSPSNLVAIDFIQENYNKDGELESVSTYNFFLTEEEIAKLCKGLSE